MSAKQPAPLPVIIDTDPGLDDALAILVALASPEFAVEGIVTVAGNLGLDITTRNALRVLALCERTDIPVVVGAEMPLERLPINAASIHGDDGLGGVAFPETTVAPLAVDPVAWTAERIAAHPPGALHVLALGPMTNLARLIRERPEAAQRLGGIVAMGGAVRDRGNITPFAEFNIAADPEAADVVLRAGLPLTLVPLDVTRRVGADGQWARRLAEAGGPIAAMAAQCVTAYIANIIAHSAKTRPNDPQEMPLCPLHDPCVMIFQARPDLFTTERLPIRVITDRSPADGATVIDAANGTLVDVLTGADSQGALEWVAGRLGLAARLAR
jgi:purine nucleosidase/pyrimidine-specific ribonucleoside hydrolase